MECSTTHLYTHHPYSAQQGDGPNFIWWFADRSAKQRKNTLNIDLNQIMYDL